MDRNAVLGLFLIGLIILGYTFFFSPAPVPVKDVKAPQVTQHDTATSAAAQPVDSISKLSTLPAAFSSAAKGEEKEIRLENDTLILKISTKGGHVTSAQLKGFRTYDSLPMVLMNKESGAFTFEFSVGTESIKTKDLYFTAVAGQPNEKSSSSVVLTADLGGGKSIVQTYALPREGFMVEYTLSLNGLENVIPAREGYIELDWQSRIMKNELDDLIASQNTTIHYMPVDETPDYLSETSDEEEKFKLPTRWVSFKEQFFCQALITETPFEHVTLATKDLAAENLEKQGNEKEYLKQLNAHLTLPYDHKPNQTYNMQLFYGPLHYRTMAKHNLELERQIPLGWSFFLTSFVNRYLIIPVFNLLSNFMSNFGIIILILTIFIKLLVLPLTYRSYLSSAKMRLLKPEIDTLKAKLGNDMAKVQMEQMKIFRKAGVSPMGGCLPLLLQLPILIAMFRFFPSSIELRQEKFLWANDLSTYDSIATLPFTIPFYGDHVSLFTLLMTISTILYTHMNNKISPQQNEFKYLSYIMPVFLLGFFNSYSAGLSLYYFFFNILTILQQYLFRQVIDDNKLMAKLEANKKRPQSDKRSGFQRRLEEMAKQQQMRKR
ncbi:MAG: membrane protein insertase YidC [Bacteroidota bacterium]|nr:membrane protein insertase YidC [Bacteroidota bacterium]